MPILIAIAEPGGPVEHGDFESILNDIRDRLRAALPVDGVYACLHGAAPTTAEDDPDGIILAMIRGMVGPEVPIVATLDLHANVSEAMVDAVDMFVDIVPILMSTSGNVAKRLHVICVPSWPG